MQHLTFLIKPASSLCNMRCRYCFYEDVSDNRLQKQMGIMTASTAQRIIQEAFRAISKNGTITFFFQGGEPTLAGLDFFRNFVQLEKALKKPGVAVYHGIQTNGYCIDEEWASFFREENFLVGLSLDGLQSIHDTFRPDAAGSGTWARTIKALETLTRFQVETNILCVVTAQVAKKARQVYKNLTRLGSYPLQFIPCLDPLEGPRGTQSYSLTPESYTTFLCHTFDCWYKDWKEGRYVSIRTFDDYLCHLLRLPSSSCSASGSCGHYLVVEGDGSLYPCDFYVLDPWYLGNIQSCSVEDALNFPASQAFLAAGCQRPASCTACRYAPLCRGGCKRDWDNSGGNYYCAAYQTFFAYSITRLEEMAAAYVRSR